MDLIFKIFVYSWIISIFFGIIVAISYPIFIDNADNKSEVFMPLYNLFSLCSFNGYDEKFGLLFLLPGINILFMMFMCYKLKEKYGLSTLFGIGLIILPFVFMPILAYSKKYSGSYDSYTYGDGQTSTVVVEPPKNEKKERTKKIKKEKKVKEESKIEELDDTEVFDENALSDDDSIFKLQPKAGITINNKPYRAKRVRVNEQFINSAPAEREKIEKIEKEDN